MRPDEIKQALILFEYDFAYISTLTLFTEKI